MRMQRYKLDEQVSSRGGILPLPPETICAACRFCHRAVKPQFQLRILGRYDVWYERCTACGSLQAESPFWLSEAYASNIAPSDVGAVDRCLSSRAVVWLVLRTMGRRSVSLLDFGGGSGLLCRLLRDIGIDAWTSDAHAEAVYAQTYQVTDRGGVDRRFDVITAFEVFEHFSRPDVELNQLFAAKPDVLIASTTIYQPDTGKEWWYLAPDTGQHVFFYSRKALAEIAAQFGYALFSQGSWHIFTRTPLSVPNKLFLSLALRPRGLKLCRMLLEGASHSRYIARDYQQVVKADAVSRPHAP